MPPSKSKLFDNDTLTDLVRAARQRGGGINRGRFRLWLDGSKKRVGVERDGTTHFIPYAELPKTAKQELGL